jgi:hypothetical protein
LTRRVSLADADFIAGTKGLAAGIANLSLAVVLGYGVSLVLFVLALRGLGAAIAVIALHEPTRPGFWVSAARA